MDSGALGGAAEGTHGDLGDSKAKFSLWGAAALAAKGAEMAQRWGRGRCGLGGWCQGTEMRGGRVQGKVGPPAVPLSPGFLGRGCRAWRFPSRAAVWPGVVDSSGRRKHGNGRRKGGRSI